MKGSTPSSPHNHDSLPPDFGEFDEKEMEVADILLNMEFLASLSESRKRFAFTWGSKGRRSALGRIQSPSLLLRPSPSPSLQRTCQGKTGIETETERRPKVKVEATSPATPLSFSPSESDDKSKHSRNKASKKRQTREDLLQLVDELTSCRELLRREKQNVKIYYNKLVKINLALKAKKQELSSCHEKERNSHSEIRKNLNLGMELDQPMAKPHIGPENQENHLQIQLMLHHKALIVDQTAYVQMPTFLPSSPGFGGANRLGPLVIPDLNVPSEETFAVGSSRPLDQNRIFAENRAKAAEARRLRMLRVRERKNSSVTIK